MKPTNKLKPLTLVQLKTLRAKAAIRAEKQYKLLRRANHLASWASNKYLSAKMQYEALDREYYLKRNEQVKKSTKKRSKPADSTKAIMAAFKALPADKRQEILASLTN